MINPRSWIAIAFGAAILLLATAAWWSSLWLAIASAVSALAGVVALALLRPGWRRVPDFGEQERLIAQLWRSTRRLPNGTLLLDPETGQLLSARRSRGSLTLGVFTPVTDEQAAVEAVGTCYALGHLLGRSQPPLFRSQVPLGAGGDDTKMTMADAIDVLLLNEATGVMNTDTAELRALAAQVDRVLKHHRLH